MKKIVNVNIAGLSYVIDTDGYDMLRGYLRDVESRIPNKIEAGEMIEDIEARISDLFTDMGVSSPRVVTAAHVQKAIETIGDPDVFGEKKSFNFSEKISEKFSQTFNNNQNSNNTKPLRKFMRDKSDSIFGGLCSGLGAYLSIETALVRVVAVVLGIITGGIPMLIAYIVCLFIVPVPMNAEDQEILDQMKRSR